MAKHSSYDCKLFFFKNVLIIIQSTAPEFNDNMAKRYNTLISCFDKSVIKHIQHLNVDYGNTVHWPLQGLEASKEFRSAPMFCKIEILNDIASQTIKEACK